MFVDASVLFELPYMQIWSVSSNRGYTRFEPELLNLEGTSLYSESYRQITVYENP